MQVEAGAHEKNSHASIVAARLHERVMESCCTGYTSAVKNCPVSVRVLGLLGLGGFYVLLRAPPPRSFTILAGRPNR